MEIINVDIKNKEDFFEEYDNSIISNKLLDYIINASIPKIKSNLKIVINSQLDIDFNTLIKEGLNKELNQSLEEKKIRNYYQILLIFLGIFFICLSVLFQDFIIWHEVLLIGGWVPIWEAVDIELFRDSQSRKRRYIIKKLLKSEIEIHETK